MSLIQDALKRQQEESESSRVPLKTAPARPPATLGAALQAGNAAPSVPDAMPVPSSPPAIRQPTDSIACPLSLRGSVAGGRAGPEPSNRPLPAAVPPVNLEKPVRSGKSWKLIAGIVIVCILIVWGSGLLVVSYMKHLGELPLPSPFMPNLTRDRATLGKSPVQASPPAVQPPATAMSKPVVNPVPARASASKSLLSPAAADAPAFADEGEDVEENAALPSVKEQVEPLAVPGTAIWPQLKVSAMGSSQEGARLKPVVWPRLKLSAVFSNVGSGQSGARLNNRLILLGDQIDGVTLVEIHRDSVVLKCGKETRLLKMGMILN